MDLKRLKHLVALADTRNFGRAAVQCHLTQSALAAAFRPPKTNWACSCSTGAR
ncbi:MAG: LysR family transcriptional regulator [Haliea sp.]|nr:LysR family transcriptional regulator [Haliea sp.]